jgi:hypothetical protein
VITESTSLFGAGSEYFTVKYGSGTRSPGPALFAMVATNISIDSFEITGNNGADSGGSVNGAVLTSTNGQFDLFVKRVFGTSDPSINHIIMVPSATQATHNFATNTDNDQHEVVGLSNATEIYYALVASTSGGFINDEQIVAIADEFLRNVQAFAEISRVNTPRTEPVSTVDLTFDAPIDPSSFDFNDLTLVREGGPNLINSNVTITNIGSDSFQVGNLADLTASPGDYTLIFEGAGITSSIGTPLEGADEIRWSCQALTF